MRLLSPNEFRKSFFKRLNEEFNSDSYENNYEEDNDLPDSVKLKDGNYLFFWEEPFEDMAGETNYFIKYAVSPDFKPENFKEVSYKDIESLLVNGDKEKLKAYQKELGDSNANNSINWVK